MEFVSLTTIMAGAESTGRCTLDQMAFDCVWAKRLVGIGAAAPCTNNNCESRFNGREWESLRFTEQGLSYSPLKKSAPAKYAHAQRRKKPTLRTRGATRPRTVGGAQRPRRTDGTPQGIETKYPPVTASDINIVNWSKPFDRIGQQVVNDVIDIANNQTCSDAFKKYHLRIPYDLVRSDKLRLVPSGFLYDDTASHTLGISQDLVESIRYDLSTGIILWGDAAVTIGGSRPMIVVGSSASQEGFGGLKSVLIHEFIHAEEPCADRSRSNHVETH